MGAHHPAELSLSLVTYGLRLGVYDEARLKHWTISVDPIVRASHSIMCHHYSSIHSRQWLIIRKALSHFK